MSLDSGKTGDERSTTMPDEQNCPGCHIGCALSDPQCARGLKIFRPIWLDGKDLAPYRRSRGFTKPQGTEKPESHNARREPRAALGRDEKLAHLLVEVLPRLIGSRIENDRDRLLTRLVHQGGGMSCRIMPERARVDECALAETIEGLLDEGLVCSGTTECGSEFLWVTDKGRSAAEQAKERHSQATRDCFRVLDENEKQFLDGIIEKLLSTIR